MPTSFMKPVPILAPLHAQTLSSSAFTDACPSVSLRTSCLAMYVFTYLYAHLQPPRCGLSGQELVLFVIVPLRAESHILNIVNT